MRQIIHIFKKDVRHHWPEIALCQVALALFVWVEIDAWRSHGQYFGIVSYWRSAIYFLFPFSWWFLTVRVVQSESLVGENQFWITRPYEWKKLLGAKIFFILICINLPLFFAQLFLLKKADFLPFHYLPGLLWMQLGLIAIPFLPLLALATVAKNMAQELLVLLAVILFIGGMIALAVRIDDSAMSSSDESDWAQFATVIIACVAAVWVQYRKRRTGRSRIFLGSGAIVIAIMVLVSPYVIHGETDYPLSSNGSGVSVQAGLSSLTVLRPKLPPLVDKDVEIELPITVAGLPEGFLGNVNGVQLTLALPNGFQWQSKWEYGVPDLLLPGQNGWRQQFKLHYKDFQRLMPGPVKAKVSLAFTFFRDQDAREIKVQDSEFEIAGTGRCRNDHPGSSDLTCNSPLLKPETLLIRAESNQSTCEPPASAFYSKPTSMTFYAWEHNKNDQPAEYGINPVQSFPIYLRNRDNHMSICPGTPLRVSFPRFVERRRVEFKVEKFDLNEYREDPMTYLQLLR